MCLFGTKLSSSRYLPTRHRVSVCAGLTAVCHSHVCAAWTNRPNPLDWLPPSPTPRPHALGLLPGDLSWDLFQGRTQSSPSKCLLAMDAISTHLWDLCSKQPAIHVIPRDRAVGTYTGHHAGSREIVAVLVCFFFLSAVARLGNVAVVPMRPASLQPYEERRGGVIRFGSRRSRLVR